MRQLVARRFVSTAVRRQIVGRLAVLGVGLPGLEVRAPRAVACVQREVALQRLNGLDPVAFAVRVALRDVEDEPLLPICPASRLSTSASMTRCFKFSLCISNACVFT